MSTDKYVTPLVERWASAEMAALFSAKRKFSIWRRCWLALAEAQLELGLDISEEQLTEMRAHLDDVDLDRAREIEGDTRHDVVAHIRAFGEQCPAAKPIIHLGATSCYVGDNTDLILIRDALGIVRRLVFNIIDRLAEFAREHAGLATLGYTHFQPAQCVTVGKRATLWLQDLLMDLRRIEGLLGEIKCRGAKGTTGTQASYMKLFGGDHEKVRRLDALVAQKLGFDSSYPVTGQTYPRKLDGQVFGAMAGVGSSACKFGNDMRLLQRLGEMSEPFGAKQTGSSAMAYKRNPMRAERMCSLGRYLMLMPAHADFTAATQWFERTLDDSAIRRVTIPETFLAADAVLNLYLNIVEGLRVHPKVIERHIAEELPFMATENILMAAVQKGGDRQELHELIRQHAIAAADAMRDQGADNDLLERLADDPGIPLDATEIDRLLDVSQFVGRAPEQVTEFINTEVTPILDAARTDGLLGLESEVNL